ncbi:MAG: S4 domain-containing protein [Desulfocapsaceae bacterium]|nr:S4 domain-containing protein [Desulfocapsaceae bacterium]
MTESNEKIRLDKWLWAARFFKTRSLASQAVNGGRVHLNGSRIKASRAVNIGDTLLINKSGMEFEIIVLALNDKRRPAVEARQLYEESSESIAKRSEQAEQRKLIRAGQPAPAKRPDKRDRRKIREFTRKR